VTEPVLSLLAILGSLGVRLSAAGGRLSYEAPRGVMTADLKQRVIDHRDELLVNLGKCPGCGRAFDRGRCWRCNYRVCACGKNTGSAFIDCCITCEFAGRP
jgi:hypothetical protein